MKKHKPQIWKVMLAGLLGVVAVFPNYSSTTASAASTSKWPQLTEIVQPIIESADKEGIRVSVGIRDLNGAYENQKILLGNDSVYKPASTIKMALVSTLMLQVDAGKKSLSDTVTVEPDDVVGGTGSLQKETFPQQITLDRLARLMITQSDNTATNVLIDAVGLDQVQALMDQLDLKVMHLGRKMFASAPTPEQDNYINAEDLVTLLEKIYKGEFLTDKSRNQIITWMSAQEVNTKFGAALPTAPIAHKTGENANVTHDVGYFLVPGHEIAISVMTEVTTTTDFDEAQKLGNPVVQSVAKAVYGYLMSGETQGDASTTMTRAAFVKLLVPALGLQVKSPSSSFVDVSSDSDFAKYATAAYQAGIVNGTTGNKFEQDSLITRAEMITMYVRAYEYIHGEITDYSESSSYNDMDTAPTWAIPSALKAQHLWGANSDSDETLNPSQKVNQAEGHKMIERLWFTNN
ncbi:serine hydrolase [Cohnella sp. WQ 127256]|uniref:serine hydrolase n=1 Tax=Cohnella sp. WQ 127256 TaxID=2938790 RepID=UPI0021196C71|nr:serine hydrolase [Cohnella sp. WQ 127256]